MPNNGDPFAMMRNRKAIIRMMLYVMNRRWCSMLVFVLLGLAVSCGVYSLWPTVYEAKSVFTKNAHPSKGDYDETCNEMEWYSDYGELFEQERSGWRSKEFFSRVIRQFRGDFPGSIVTDEALGEMLEDSTLERMGHSHRIVITIRSPNAEIAAALANAYAEAVKTLTDEMNKERCEKALVQIHQQVERARNLSNEIYQDLVRCEKEHRIAVEQTNLHVFVLRAAQVPTRPVAPNPLVIIPIGTVLSLGLGLLYCQIIHRRGSVSKGLDGSNEIK